MLYRDTFNNKTIRPILKEAKENNYKFEKSDVSGHSILMIETDNSMTSFTYYDDVNSRDSDFAEIQRHMTNGKS